MAVLECPFCYKPFEVDPPDNLHTAFSSDKPIRSSFHGDVVKAKVKCKNPECGKTVSIYWYAPLEYFNRI
jgi:hypothetical protein